MTTSLDPIPAVDSLPAAPREPGVGPVVQIDGVSFQYGARRALEKLDLQIWSGETFALLGPNGSGKSTLFRLLSTLVPLHAGSIRIFGRDVTADTRVVRQGIGVVFQAPALDPQLTARENLLCHGRLHGLSGKALKTRVTALLEAFDLSGRGDDFVKTFSGGMRRKVELAKALLTEPKLLILDEPSTGLDPGARLELWQTLNRLKAERGVTIVFTTHLMGEADHADRVAILDEGKLLACDTPDMLKADVGGDIITLTGSDLAGLQEALRVTLNIEATIANRTLRIERPAGHLFVPQLVSSFPGAIDSVSLGRPTLDDVFVKMTGRGLTAIDAANASARRT